MKISLIFDQEIRFFLDPSVKKGLVPLYQYLPVKQRDGDHETIRKGLHTLSFRT